MNTAFTRISMNSKTGPMPVTYTSADSCPDACPFKSNGCYADGGPIKIHWRKVTEGERGMNFDEFCGEIKQLPKNQLFRHNAAGDLQGKNNVIDFPALKKLVKANKGKRGFTYTHKPVLIEDVTDSHLTTREKWQVVFNNRNAIKFANDNGFTVNLSGNNLSHADKLKALNIAPVVSVVPIDQKTTKTDDGNKAVVCPAISKDNVSCVTCGLCQVGKRGAIVAFPAHGFAKNKVSQLATS